MSADNKKKRVVIKIGSSSLTSLHGEMSRRKLERLVDEVARLKDDGHEVLLVSSGAVAAGYRKLGCLTRPDSLPEKQAAAAIGQGLLIEAYSDLFISHGYVASQILITRSDFSDEDRYNNARNTINVLLERGIIPIVNENDTVTIDRLKFGDNDTLSAKVAGLVDADQLIILSDIDGLYDDDPRKNPNAQLLKEVNEITEDIEEMAGEPGSSVGTGGMRSKIDAFKISMASGIPSFLGKSGTPNIIYDAVQATAKGTYFELEDQNVNLDLKQQWIAFNSGPEGEITIDGIGKDRILQHKKNLKAAGIYSVKGEFKSGSVVRIQDIDGDEIGLGVVNYNSDELTEFSKLTEEELKEFKDAVVEIEALVCHMEVPIPVGV
ncbi:glutamate 5-kinase [Rossellomorea sp. BNER]|jgi:glutamate 5-kinase|uniref:glutamate 5-kinase n=1 Tax=Rossellomorea sp. BNER TaxID=2962031 RepID=UPI003AF1E802|nr:glutamate 5-kinase [Rossellomorea sp. BNER]